jgi:hypothetical protein
VQTNLFTAGCSTYLNVQGLKVCPRADPNRKIWTSTDSVMGQPAGDALRASSPMLFNTANEASAIIWAHTSVSNRSLVLFQVQ